MPHDRAESREQRANARRVPVVAFCSLLFALCSFSVSVRAEIIDRVLAILPGQIITLSDVEAALDLGLVEAPAGGDRVAGGLSARHRSRADVERSAARGAARAVACRDRRAGRAHSSARSARAAELSRVLAARGLDETVLRLYAADDLRLASYLDERFSAAAQPTDEEIRQAGESARQRLDRRAPPHADRRMDRRAATKSGRDGAAVGVVVVRSW